jgi:hypothetical protein
MVRVGVLTGLCLLVLALGIGGVVALAGGKGAKAQATTPTPSVYVPPFPVREYRDTGRNFAVNVPQTWTKGSGGQNYVDFTDPDDKSRRLRIIVEQPITLTPHRYLEVAEGRLKDPGTSTTCAQPYQQIAFRDVQLANQPAAELEYTCGQGDQTRHGIWRAIVVGGKGYGFFVSVPDSRFDEDKVIFDEMVRSFRLLA